jgi:integrase
VASIKKRADGVWRARYRDETGREHAKHFSRKVDAQRWLTENTASVLSGTWVDPRAGTVAFIDYFTQWAQRQVWVAGTHQNMKLAAGSTAFAAMPIKAVMRSHIEEWVKVMADVGLAPTTISTRFANVRAIFRAAHRDRVIAIDPSEGVVLPRKRRLENAMAIPEPQQVGMIIDVAEPSFQALIGLCAFAGLRLGEAAAIQLGDIDFLRHTITIARQIRQGEGCHEIADPKYGSERTVYICDGLTEMLALHIEHFGVRPEGWLFVGASGRPPNRQTVNRWWRATLRRAGLTGIRLHDLRHFYASGLIAAGCDVVTVQRALGHLKASTTLNTYSHLWPKAEERTRAAAEAIMAEALGDSADSVRTKQQ